MSIKLRIAGAFVSLKTTLPAGVRPPQSIAASDLNATGDRRFWLSARALVLTNSGSLRATFGYPAARAVQVPASDGLRLLKAWLGVSFR